MPNHPLEELLHHDVVQAIAGELARQLQQPSCAKALTVPNANRATDRIKKFFIVVIR